MDVYLWLLALWACFTLTQTQSCKNEQKCRISRIHGMKGADCFNKNIRDFPQCLSSDVEIIDLSTNRIRKLTKNDLKKYDNLKMLYLSDNVIVTIDDEAFQEMDDLTTLDLSWNAISKLSPVVFHLPSLKSLYLGQNLNINIVDVVEKAKPVTSPLVQLDIGYVMQDDYSVLPDLGILPFLTKYNISGNKLINITIKQFAGLCSLKILDTSNVSAEFVKLCDCWALNWWLKNRKVAFTPFECDIQESECFDDTSSDNLKTFEECLAKKETIVQKSRMLKIMIPVAIGVVLILIIVIYFVVRRRRQRRQEKRRNREEQTMLNNGSVSNKM